MDETRDGFVILGTTAKMDSKVQVSESLGSVSVRVMLPEKPVALVVLAHGAGAGMHHSFMESLAQELDLCGIGSVRFNFPYMEKKSRRPDPAPVAEKTVDVIMNYSHKLCPSLPLFASGKSFGGRMTSQRLAKDCPDFVKGVIFYGFPLHPVGAPAIDRSAHLKNVKIPMLFLQGTNDKLAEVALIRKVCSDLSLAQLTLFEGADHSFKSGKKILIPELAEATLAWIKDNLGLKY